MCEEQKVKLNLISSIEVGSTDESENKRLFLKVEEGLKKGIYNIVYFEFQHYMNVRQPSFMMFHQLILSELGEKSAVVRLRKRGMIYFTLKMYVNTYGKMERTGSILVYTIYLVVNSHYGKKV